MINKHKSASKITIKQTEPCKKQTVPFKPTFTNKNVLCKKQTTLFETMQLV